MRWRLSHRAHFVKTHVCPGARYLPRCFDSSQSTTDNDYFLHSSGHRSISDFGIRISDFVFFKVCYSSHYVPVLKVGTFDDTKSEIRIQKSEIKVSFPQSSANPTCSH